MTNITITVDMMMEKQPCKEWPRERVAAYLGNGKTLTAMLRDALNDNGISIQDAIWGVTRFLPDKTNRAFAIWCARQCETDIKEITDYIDTIERYYAGKATSEELDAANQAANRAAYLAANRAAYQAAYMAAYWAAYRAANWAVRKSQAEKLIEMIDAVEGE